jgi:dolichyl-phosphate beta-glucosyltransferase
VTDQAGSPGPSWLEIIVPARNEQDRLPSGLAALSAKAAALSPGVSIIVVDSASSDRTAAIAAGWSGGPVPVRLVRCDRPGKGAAVRAGLLASQAPLVGFCDADMATGLSALDDVVQRLQQGHLVVIGSRAHPDSDVRVRHSSVRKAGAAVFRWVARRVVPGVGDTQCGFKFFSGPLARRAANDLRATGFAFDIELLARCRQLGAELLEIPVDWRDVPGSTFSIGRHSLAAFAEVVTIRLALRAAPAWAGGTAESALALPPGPVAGMPVAGVAAAGEP